MWVWGWNYVKPTNGKQGGVFRKTCCSGTKSPSMSIYWRCGRCHLWNPLFFLSPSWWAQGGDDNSHHTHTHRSITMMSDAQFCVFCQSPGSTSPSRKQECESTVTVSTTAEQTHAEDWQTNWYQILKLHDNKTHSGKQETQTDNVYFPKACFWLYCECIFGACFYNENKMLSWSNLF